MMDIRLLELPEKIERFLLDGGVKTVEMLDSIGMDGLILLAGYRHHYAARALDGLRKLRRNELYASIERHDRGEVTFEHNIPGIPEEDGTVYFVKLSKKTNTFDTSPDMSEDLGLIGMQKRGRISDFNQVWRCSFDKLRKVPAGYGFNPAQAFTNAKIRLER